jgi:hypothetical protein
MPRGMRSWMSRAWGVLPSESVLYWAI